MKPYEAYNNTIELKSLVKQLFEDYLDIWEESRLSWEINFI
jgi:hypothetical protein